MLTAKLQMSQHISVVSPESMLFAQISVGQVDTSAKELDMWSAKGPSMCTEKLIGLKAGLT